MHSRAPRTTGTGGSEGFLRSGVGRSVVTVTRGMDDGGVPGGVPGAAEVGAMRGVVTSQDVHPQDARHDGQHNSQQAGAAEAGRHVADG